MFCFPTQPLHWQSESLEPNKQRQPWCQVSQDLSFPSSLPLSLSLTHTHTHPHTHTHTHTHSLTHKHTRACITYKHQWETHRAHTHDITEKRDTEPSKHTLMFYKTSALLRHFRWRNLRNDASPPPFRQVMIILPLNVMIRVVIRTCNCSRDPENPPAVNISFQIQSWTQSG